VRRLSLWQAGFSEALFEPDAICRRVRSQSIGSSASERAFRALTSTNPALDATAESAPLHIHKISTLVGRILVQAQFSGSTAPSSRIGSCEGAESYAGNWVMTE
jgi:hypothetical protein